MKMLKLVGYSTHRELIQVLLYGYALAAVCFAVGVNLGSILFSNGSFAINFIVGLLILLLLSPWWPPVLVPPAVGAFIPRLPYWLRFVLIGVAALAEGVIAFKTGGAKSLFP
jgi:hypothetical protein